MIQIIGLVLAGAALILNIVGLAIPYWLYFSESVKDISVSVYFGLWQLCRHGSQRSESVTGCSSFADEGISDLPSAFNITRSLEILSVIILTGSLALACLKIFVQKDNRVLLKVAGAVAVVAGIIMIVGAVVFVTNDEVKHLLDVALRGNAMTPHAGFALCIVSGCISIGAAVMFFINQS